MARLVTAALWCHKLNAGQLLLLLFLVACANALCATDSADSEVAARQLSVSGLSLRKLSTFGTFTNSPSAGAGTGNGAVFGATLGGAAEIGVLAVSNRARYSVVYTATYSRYARSRQSGAGTIDHSLNFSGIYDVSPRSCVALGLNAALLDISNSLVAPATGFQLPACFTNPLTEEFVTSSGTALSGASAILFGERVLNVDIGAIMQYRKTSRLTLSAFLQGSRTEPVFHGTAGAGQSVSDLPLVSVAQGNFQASYQLSNVTQLGFSVSDLQILSRAEQARVNSVTGIFGRQLGRGIQADFRGGIQYATRRSDSSGLSSPRAIQGRLGVGLNVNRSHHVFRFAVERKALDPYGIGAASILTTRGSWSVQPGGRNTGLSVAAEWEDLSGGTFDSLQLINLTASMTRLMNQEAEAQFAYAFTSIRSTSGDHFPIENLHILRFTVAWRPSKFRIL